MGENIKVEELEFSDEVKSELSEDDDSFDTPNEEAPDTTITLARKSREKYERMYKQFTDWCAERHLNISDKSVLAFLTERSSTRKASTIWTEYLLLKSTLLSRNDIDITKFPKLVAFVKHKIKRYKPQKSKSLTKEQIDKFLLEAPNDIYLMAKVALIFGIAGALNRIELSSILVDDIEDAGSALFVKVSEAETSFPRTFTVISEEGSPVNNIDLYRQYLALRPPGIFHRRFFIYYKNGKCSNLVVGVNTFGKLPSLIAEYLQLPDPFSFTGHCFRRTSVTLGTGTRRRGWKSSFVPDHTNEYVDEKKRNVRDIHIEGRKDESIPIIINKSPKSGGSGSINLDTNSPVTINISNCSNCEIHFTINSI